MSIELQTINLENDSSREMLTITLVKAIVPALMMSLFLLSGATDNAFESLLAAFAGYYPLTVLLGMLSLSLPWRLGTRTAALFVLSFAVMTVSIAIELQIFSTMGAGEIALYYVNGLWQLCLYTFSIAYLFSPPESKDAFEASFRQHWGKRPWQSWAWRIPAAMFSYILLYFIVGAIAYGFTEPYYTDPSYGLNLTIPPVLLIFKVQIVRSFILIIAVLSLVAGLSGSRRKVALMTGLALFALGGLTPLLSNTEWPAALRLFHTIEIFFQNAPAGIAMVFLLKPV